MNEARRLLSAFGRALPAGIAAFAIFGPLSSLLLWAFAERWYWPHKLPSLYGFMFWGRVFAPRAEACLGFFN